MAESLTDAVVSAVETAKAIIAKYGCWPFHHAPERLRDDLEALARYVRGSSSLASRAAEFRGLYATPPEPIGGPIGDVHAASYHELGRDLATWILDDIIDTAKSADGDSCPPENWDRSMSKEQLDQIARQWPAVQTYLRDPARQFDCILLVTSIRDEAAKAARSRTGGGGTAASKYRKAKRVTVNERMGAELVKHPESRDWSAQQWADALGCVKSTVAATLQFKALLAMRQGAHLERMVKKSRLSKGKK